MATTMAMANTATITVDEQNLCRGCQIEPAGTLQCPVCLKSGVKDSFFCSQDCFKRNWTLHKATHPKPPPRTYDPFKLNNYTGSVRACYPLSPRRTLPDSIQRPDYAVDGYPRSEMRDRGDKARILTLTEQEGMRKVGRLAREVLDIAARALRPGITTDEIDAIVHAACIERDAYPSPLNYRNFPKSVCTSINEVICHGIPDKRPLKDGDIINLDVTLYHGGYHGDLNETYYIGNANKDPDSVRLVETARQCLELATQSVKPGALFRDVGAIIEKHAKSRKCSTVRTYVGHGINSLFHCFPNVPHYAKNKTIGVMKPGTYSDTLWEDNWTAATVDGKRSAQFENTLLVTDTGVEILTGRLADSPDQRVSEDSTVD